MRKVGLSDARKGLTDLVDRVATKGERFAITRNGDVSAVLVPVRDLQALGIPLDAFGGSYKPLTGVVRENGGPRPVPPDVLEFVRDLRTPRRAPLKERSWVDIADEVRRCGKGDWKPMELREAFYAMPIEAHPLAPADPEDIERRDAEFRREWEADFPGATWPGKKAAIRMLAEKVRGLAAAEEAAADAK